MPLLIVITLLVLGCVNHDSSKPTPSPEPTAQDSSALKKQLDKIASKVAEIRGLSPKARVEYVFLTSDELQSELMDMAEEELPAEETAIQQEILSLLGLLEADQDLRSLLLDLYAEQVIGFYDPAVKRLFVVSETADLGPIEEVTFVHEYTHALQDQHFDLEAFLPEHSANADFDSAKMALAEGDATAVEAAYILKTFNMADAIEFLTEAASMETEKFDAAPRFLRETLMFPYEAGFEFTKTFGSHDELNSAYADPPQSTEQILHPERYRLRDAPQTIDLSMVSRALGPDWTEYDRGVWGELNTRIYLEMHVNAIEAAEAGAGWDGDQYRYLKNTQGRKLFVLHSVWDDPKDGGEFLNACSILIRAEDGGKGKVRMSGPTVQWWENKGVNFYVKWSSDRTLLIITEDESAIANVLSALPDFEGD